MHNQHQTIPVFKLSVKQLLGDTYSNFHPRLMSLSSTFLPNLSLYRKVLKLAFFTSSLKIESLNKEGQLGLSLK